MRVSFSLKLQVTGLRYQYKMGTWRIEVGLRFMDIDIYTPIAYN